jgi:hypothetical protein
MEFDPFHLYVKDLATRTLLAHCDSSEPLYTLTTCFLHRHVLPACLGCHHFVHHLASSSRTSRVLMSYPSCLAALSSLVAHRPHKSCAMEEEYEALMANHMYDLCCVSLAPTWSSTSGSSVTSSRLMIL